MVDNLSHGHNKGEKLLYNAGTWRIYITFLGYSNLDDRHFIAEDDCGYVSDDWLWEEIVEEE